METKSKKMTFCCPHHGGLSGPVEYFSVNMGSKKLVDVPVAYCKACKKYYTPFANLIAFIKPQHIRHKGCQIAAGHGHIEKGFPRIEVRIPYFIDIEEEEKAREQQELIRKEKDKQRIEGLREVQNDTIILTNKASFTNQHMCPHCRQLTRKESVKIVQDRKFVLAKIRHCESCGADYITPSQFHAIEEKVSRKIRGYISHPFVRPKNVMCEYQEEKYIFIPHNALDYDKYSHRHLPSRYNEYYDMTDKEYLWVVMYYEPEFPVQLRQKSFLGAAGYSTGESEIRRHKILEKCVSEHGKSKVINQLKSNINLRMKQKNGDIRYEHAFNVWRGDIRYVENEL